MKNKNNHVKVLSTLSLASSDTREDTLASVIIRTLFVCKTSRSEELSTKILNEFRFTPYQSELDSLVESLIGESRIEKKDGTLSLSDDEIKRVKETDTVLQTKDTERFNNFKTFITDSLEEEIGIGQIKILWEQFRAYLYDCFYQYGHDALKTLHPHMDNGDTESNWYEDVLSNSIRILKKVDTSLVAIFKRIVNGFPDFASMNDLDFLNDLAQKTLSFTSLGMKPELANETINHDLVDWVLYLDTNVLYSILGLHAHPENEACKALVKLIQANHENITIKMRYSELTNRELGNKKADFDLLDDKMNDSTIRALLKSDKLDGFSRKFYKDLLENRDATIHPKKVIELSSVTLKKSVVEIGRTGKRLESLGADYIESRITDYQKFIADKNKTKAEFCEKNKLIFNETYRSDGQARHDVSLRETVISYRNLKDGEELTMNNIKYFAVTLDGMLISYDKKRVREYEDERSYPVFFKPSFILNRLIKLLPIQTVDYKKAFIKAITTKGFHRNTKKSDDILKIVNYLKANGISDEKVIYNLITQELFLEKFRTGSDKDEFNQGEFIESELNREFKQKQEELVATNKELEASKEDTTSAKSENEVLYAKKKVIEDDVQHYKDALKTMSLRIKKLEKESAKDSPQVKVNFEAEKLKQRVDKAMIAVQASVEDQIAIYKDAKFKTWRRNTWWNLLWVLPAVIFAVFILIPNDYVTMSKLNDDGEMSNTTGILISIIMFLIVTVFLGYIVFVRFISEREKSAKYERIKIPADLNKRYLEAKAGITT
ncbi:MAG: hypothetical protein HRT58_10935 [Crocinitomicaceae bacterium]|nr:hypothetical protein [Flavobacteriales bacterium]NQZ36170.1 hypothetical protein [Crocinitomicaceae bacterium]